MENAFWLSQIQDATCRLKGATKMRIKCCIFARHPCHDIFFTLLSLQFHFSNHFLESQTLKHKVVKHIYAFKN